MNIRSRFWWCCLCICNFTNLTIWNLHNLHYNFTELFFVYFIWMLCRTYQIINNQSMSNIVIIAIVVTIFSFLLWIRASRNSCEPGLHIQCYMCLFLLIELESGRDQLDWLLRFISPRKTCQQNFIYKSFSRQRKQFTWKALFVK